MSPRSGSILHCQGPPPTFHYPCFERRSCSASLGTLPTRFIKFAMTTTPESSFNAALKDIDLKLSKHGSSTKQYGLPQVTHDSTEYDRLLRAFDTPHQIKLAADLTPQLTTEQNSIFKTLTSSDLLHQGAIYMIDSSAGTGKTFTICAITAFLRGQGQLVLCSASTGIAALIFPGGLTAHSTFKFPFGDAAVEGSTCNIQERIRTRPCPPTSRAYNLRRGCNVIKIRARGSRSHSHRFNGQRTSARRKDYPFH